MKRKVMFFTAFCVSLGGCHSTTPNYDPALTGEWHGQTSGGVLHGNVARFRFDADGIWNYWDEEFSSYGTYSVDLAAFPNQINMMPTAFLYTATGDTANVPMPEVVRGIYKINFGVSSDIVLLMNFYDDTRPGTFDFPTDTTQYQTFVGLKD